MRNVKHKEHRWSLRRPVVFDVMLYPSGGHPLEGKVHDISIGGMFVQTESPVPPAETDLQLGFRMAGEHGGEYYRMSALVVRSTAHGAGLMFKDYDEGTVQSLRRIFHEAVV